jgi:hypothetical protein
MAIVLIARMSLARYLVWVRIVYLEHFACVQSHPFVGLYIDSGVVVLAVMALKADYSWCASELLCFHCDHIELGYIRVSGEVAVHMAVDSAFDSSVAGNSCSVLGDQKQATHNLAVGAWIAGGRLGC